MSQQTVPVLRIGDVVTYETLDEEYYSRGYGIHMETKASTIISICYKLANGDVIEAKKAVLVTQPAQDQKNQTTQ